MQPNIRDVGPFKEPIYGCGKLYNTSVLVVRTSIIMAPRVSYEPNFEAIWLIPELAHQLTLSDDVDLIEIYNVNHSVSTHTKQKTINLLLA